MLSSGIRRNEHRELSQPCLVRRNVFCSPRVLATVGEISRRLHKPIHRIDYIIDSRGLQPIGRAGNARIFSEADVNYIGSELRRIDEERSGEVPPQ